MAWWEKCGNQEAPSQEMLVLGGKFCNLEGNCVIFNIKNSGKFSLLPGKKIIFSSPGVMVRVRATVVYTQLGFSVRVSRNKRTIQKFAHKNRNYCLNRKMCMPGVYPHPSARLK